MRAINFRESFEGNSRKFSKFENENEGNIFESFGIPSINFYLGTKFRDAKTLENGTLILILEF